MHKRKGVPLLAPPVAATPDRLISGLSIAIDCFPM